MSKQRRQELQKNIVADSVETAINKVGPYLIYIGGGVAAVLVVFLTYATITHFRTKELGKQWGEYISAQQSKGRDRALAQLAKERPDTAAAVWALLAKGSADLEAGTTDIFESRDAADGNLKSAVESFEAVVKKAAEFPDLAQHARYGIGVAHETRGDITEAIAAYEEVVKKGEKTPLGKTAQRRLDSLRESEAKEFYAWFKTQASFERNRNMGGLDFPGFEHLNQPLPSRDPTLPSKLENLPNFPDTQIPAPLDIPDLDDGSETAEGDKPEGDKPEGDKPEGDKPEGEPASEKDAEATEKPATEKPATEKPATEKPATEKPATDAPSNPAP